jgi:hypothetical protein
LAVPLPIDLMPTLAGGEAVGGAIGGIRGDYDEKVPAGKVRPMNRRRSATNGRFRAITGISVGQCRIARVF